MTGEQHRFPCDSCGADLRFAPDLSELICDHCGHEVEIEVPNSTTNTFRELDFKAALEATLPDHDIEETRVLPCHNCGAQVEFDETNHASECPFCATPLVTDTGTHRHIKPSAVMPFAISEPAGRAAMADWLGSLWFAPDGLQEYARKGRKLQGIYVPYWTFDADTKSRYRGEKGTVYYVNKTVTRNGKQVTQRVQKVRWRSKSGHVARWFDDILVLASTSLPKKYTDGLAPWDLGGLEPYRPEYLAGFRAEGYSVELQDGFEDARKVIDRTIRRDVKFDIGGDRQRIHNIDTDVSDVTFKHILLPVWLAAYKYRGRSYRFVVNGSNGRTQGERPWSIWKIAIAVLLLAVLAGGIGFLIATNQG